MKYGIMLLAAGGVSLIALSQAAAAQTVDHAPASASATSQADSNAQPTTADSAAAPGDIVVTATKRSERLQDVPISLAVVSGNTLENRSVGDFEQLAPLVPNLTVAKSPAANLIILRGIGSSPGSPSLDQSVVMFIDGIYAGNARQFATPFLDIERLEILRGPQGALVGRNTSAGAINIITRKPGDDFGGYLNATYNFTLDQPTIEGAVDLPASSAIKLRVAGRYSSGGGYIYNTAVDEDQPDRREAVGRITGVIDNGGPVKVTAKYEHANVRNHGIPVQLFVPSKGEYLDYKKASKLENGPEYDNVRTDNASVQFDIDLGGPSLVAISGYSAFVSRQLIDADFYSANFATADFDQNFEQYSQEFRLVSPGGRRLEYVLGAYYSDASLYEQRTTGVLFAPPASTYRQFRQMDEVYSFYGQLTWHLTDSLRANGSLRYTHENKRATYKRFGGPLAASERIGALRTAFGGNIDAGRVDPAASLQYDITRNAMIYASFGKGSKSGGFQGAISNASQASFAFRPETSTSYEVGAKLSFPGLGYFNISGFNTIYRNLQVSAAIAKPGALSADFFTGNAPKARVAGVEAQFRFDLSRVFSLDGSASWLPTAKYVDFESGPCAVGQTSNGAVAGSCDQTGNRLGFAPKYQASLNATATLPIGDYQLKGTLSPILQGFSYRDFANDRFVAQDAFAKLDARIAFGPEGERWEVAVIGKNLTGKRTIAFGSSAGLANTFFDPLSRTAVIDPPRTIAVQGRIKF